MPVISKSDVRSTEKLFSSMAFKMLLEEEMIICEFVDSIVDDAESSFLLAIVLHSLHIYNRLC